MPKRTLQPLQPRLASFPFNKPGADLIIRSSDHIDFRVQSHILLEASPIFEDMLGLPQPPSVAQDADQRPVVDVTEDAHTLDMLLRICYPIEKKESNVTIDEIEAGLMAALKYEMALPISVLSKKLLAEVEAHPFTVWITACRIGLEEHANAAAKILRSSTNVESIIRPEILPNLAGVSAGSYYRLCELLRTSESCRSRCIPKFLCPPTQTDWTAIDTTTLQTPPPSVIDMPFPDLICKSSDGAEFRVHRGVIASGSPVLRNEIAALLDGHGESPAASSQNESLPILQMSETSNTLHPLLSMCYPATADVQINLYSYAGVMTAAAHYEMSWLRDRIMAQWNNSAWRDPVKAYFVAVNSGWDEGAQAAARLSLVKPLDELYSSEMENAPAQAYERLIQYHKAFKLLLGATKIQYPFSVELLRDSSILALQDHRNREDALYSGRMARIAALNIVQSRYDPRSYKDLVEACHKLHEDVAAVRSRFTPPVLVSC